MSINLLIVIINNSFWNVLRKSLHCIWTLIRIAKKKKKSCNITYRISTEVQTLFQYTLHLLYQTMLSIAHSISDCRKNVPAHFSSPSIYLVSTSSSKMDEFIEKVLSYHYAHNWIAISDSMEKTCACPNQWIYYVRDMGVLF